MVVRVLALVACISAIASGATVRGIVKDPVEFEIPGAHVALRSAQASQEMVADTQGQFAFENVAPGTYAREVLSAGFVANRQTVVVGEEPDVDLGTITIEPSMGCPGGGGVNIIYSRSAPGTAHYSGRVLQNEPKMPLVGAKVSLRKRTPSFYASTTTDRQGRFYFRGIQPGEYLVEISSAGHNTLIVNSVILESGKSARVSQALFLPTCPANEKCNPISMTVPDLEICM